MASKYRMLIDRSGEALEQHEPGFFGWIQLEWFSFAPDSRVRDNGTFSPNSGTFSIGLPLGHPYYYLTQAMTGDAPLANIHIENTTAEGKRYQIHFRETLVESATYSHGFGSVEISYQRIELPNL
jgi:hypothetical protein